MLVKQLMSSSSFQLSKEDQKIVDSMMRFRLEQFLKESNEIEGEEWDNLPFKAAEFALHQVNMTPVRIKKIHGLLGKDMSEQNKIQLGEFRKVWVRVGGWLAPSPTEVPSLISQYCEDWHTMDSWTAHNRFEAIHPFEDGNGRVGRLLWLAKARKEGYMFGRSFLHEFYYQTLKHQV
jgi:hypothetical protein